MKNIKETITKEEIKTIIDKKIEKEIEQIKRGYWGMDTEQLWHLDKGKTYRSFELNQIETFKGCKKGKKVETTIFAKGNGVSKKHHFGRFMGLSNSGYIRVKPDGLKTTFTYWVGFWQPV